MSAVDLISAHARQIRGARLLIQSPFAMGAYYGGRDYFGGCYYLRKYGSQKFFLLGTSTLRACVRKKSPPPPRTRLWFFPIGNSREPWAYVFVTGNCVKQRPWFASMIRRRLCHG